MPDSSMSSMCRSGSIPTFSCRPGYPTVLTWKRPSSGSRAISTARGSTLCYGPGRTSGGRNSSARLIILGEFVRGALAHAPVSVRRWKNLIIEDYPDDRISVWETMEPLTADDLATLYRSVDFVVSTARSEGFGFVVAESMACGTVPIFPAYGATGEFAFEDALTLRGNEARADYSDKGFGDVGNWWEPDASHLTELLHEACTMDPEARRTLSARAVKKITANYTWRHTGFAIARALRTLQNPEPRAADRAPSPLPQTRTLDPRLAWLKRDPAPRPPGCQTGPGLVAETIACSPGGRAMRRIRGSRSWPGPILSGHVDVDGGHVDPLQRLSVQCECRDALDRSVYGGAL